jgi:hypothetical protein
VGRVGVDGAVFSAVFGRTCIDKDEYKHEKEFEMPSPEEIRYAQDAETSMRSAARLVIQLIAAGVPKSEIVFELESQGLFLPDPEGFIDAVSRKYGEEPAEPEVAVKESSMRMLLTFGAGMVGGLAFSLVVAVVLGFGASLLNIGFAEIGGKVAGALAGGGFAFWAKEHDYRTLYLGAIAGVVAYFATLLIAFLVFN